eukprot:gb/GEZN01000386.1/.p1 GENE.gb/GEZN01000386.1/~~gb/GEZN01000386.1/.p1  ORF type:complete len:1466 (+),score=213.20 gb/GEZN01000386.1/:60-4457(+)
MGNTQCSIEAKGYQIWDAEKEDFTPCFADVLWCGPPLLCVLIIVLFQLQQPPVALNTRVTPAMKAARPILWSSLIFVVGGVLLALVGIRDEEDLLRNMAACLFALSWALNGYFHQTAVETDPDMLSTLFPFWVISWVCYTIKVSTSLRKLDENTDFLHVILYALVSFDVLWALFNFRVFFPFQSRETMEPLLLGKPTFKGAGWAKVEDCSKEESSQPAGGYSRECPEERASFYSKLFFSWLSGLLKIGNQHPLQLEDLIPANPRDNAEPMLERFEAAWNLQKQTQVHPSLAKAIRIAFGRKFFMAGIYKFLHDCLLFAGPALLTGIISFLESDDPLAVGLYYALAMVLAGLLQSVFLHQYFHACYVTGMNVRAGLVGSLYRKSLRLAGGSQNTGELVNLMALDSTRLRDLFPYLHMVWSSWFQIAFSVYFLYQQIGASVFAGLGFMILLMPINGAVAKWSLTYQKQLMKTKDVRIKGINELLSNIKVIKSYAWETTFGDHISETREEELSKLRKYIYVSTIQRMMWWASPTWIALVAFGTFSLTGGELTASVAFTTLALFQILRFPIAMLPMVINSLINSWVSLKRLQTFLLTPEPEQLPEDPAGLQIANRFAREQGLAEVILHVDSASFYWDSELKKPALESLSLDIRKNQLVFVIGQTGSGKTALLSALIGNLYVNPRVGSLTVNGKMAYVAQKAWIQNMSLRDNVLFGKRFIQDWYDRVIDACALRPDIDMLPNGDATEIGEKGINISGGQKQRVALARAVYQDADLLLLDDPLSAVDSHVAKHIFENCFEKLLREKTVVLVTHAVNFLPAADNILVMRDSHLEMQGTYNQLSSRLDLSQFVSHHEDSKEESVDDCVALEATATKTKDVTNKKEGGELIKEEEKAYGQVRYAIYKEYVRTSGGYLLWSLVLVLMLVGMLTNLGTNLWLAEWAAAEVPDAGYYLGIYAAIGMAYVFSTLLATFTLSMGGLVAARKMHQAILNAVIRAPMSFFDTTPVGRIVNRFTGDIDVVDQQLASVMSSYLSQLFNFIGVVVIISFVTPAFMLALVPLGYVYYYIQEYYVKSSRELKRWDSLLCSPIYSHFGESIDGVATIRAFGKMELFRAENAFRVDRQQGVYYSSVASNRWLAIRLETMGNMMVGIAALAAVLGKGTISAEYGGLSISYSLSITGTLNWMVRMASDRETNIVSVERVLEYAEVQPEAPAVILGQRPPLAWPQHGKVVIDKLQMRYRPGLPLVLKGLSTTIQPRQKIGVIGRTGSGKSSLFLCLLRLVEASGGKVVIDGVDVSTIGLQDLRSRMSIIPQDPVCFSGSVRYNLDPFGRHTDEEIWKAIQFARLAEKVRSMDGGLDAELKEGGCNLSMGQRQLLCLARALLRKARILLLDEATSAVDYQTDQALQDTIRTAFADCTVLIIAHRLNSVLGCDRVLVIEDGNLVEDGPPKKLLSDPTSRFFAMSKALNQGRLD